MDMYEYHVPVLLNESVEGLNIHPDGIYVDATFGGGGHSREILKRLKEGHLYGVDQDEDAKKQGSDLVGRSFTFIDGNFRFIRKYLKFYGIKQVDGVLADLGISSHQIDQPHRGFSTRFEGDLDMRMNASISTGAADIINDYDEENLRRILYQYGEVKNGSQVARAIIQERVNGRIEKISELKSAILRYAPRGKENKFLAQVFQALRIEVNQEMEALSELLSECSEIIRPGGRLVVISYHSLEDRQVKNFIKSGNTRGEIEKDLYGNIIRPFEPFTRKPITPGTKEIEENRRARSAKLRIAVKN